MITDYRSNNPAVDAFLLLSIKKFILWTFVILNFQVNFATTSQSQQILFKISFLCQLSILTTGAGASDWIFQSVNVKSQVC